MSDAPLFRDTIGERLREDLIGPQSEDEVLSDRPTQLYSTGILYPRDTPIEQEEDREQSLAVNESEEAASEPDTSGVPLYTVLKPSVAGFSFAVSVVPGEGAASVQFDINCASYEAFGVDESGEQLPGPPSSRSRERWRRVPHLARVNVALGAGVTIVDPAALGIEGLELYVLVTPHADLLNVTAALSNLRARGDTRVFDEAQHFFQVEMAVYDVAGGAFAPRPSRRAETDEDSRSAALIYRDVKEYVVGHTCSALAILSEDDEAVVTTLRTEWIPRVVVPSVSDRGDRVFESLLTSDNSRPLEAAWLASTDRESLVLGLERLVAAYRDWIDEQERRLGELPQAQQSQARKHLDQCSLGADRMQEGVEEIGNNHDVRTAFQLSQEAMRLQFGWLRDGDTLVWRPFQLGFQLLVIASVATRSHPDRNVMDLLWFPTGGGKTEAYLALTAFVILLRRLRATEQDGGSGVAVLMRYTLRLLTVQQFQRAAAMILACELLRRRSKLDQSSGPNLGTAPIGIGLWVGSAATPNTLKEARDQKSDSPSTFRQMSDCPACGNKLAWRLLARESSVTCSSEPADCELAESKEGLPIWTIDEEVYRHTPSLLVGTVDKFAQIVRNMNTRVLFAGTAAASPPDLIIQDELHLISGPLGSIAGLYEVAIDELCRRGEVRPKVVGSTATIRKAEEQIRALFDRNTYQFPAPGLDAGNSGFAVTDHTRPGRLYMGVTTAGRSATYMLQALTASLLQSAADPSASAEERDFYWTQVVYFNSLRELGHALVLMQDDVPVSVGQLSSRRDEAERPISAPAELTSRVKSYEIRDMLDRLAKSAEQPDAVTLLLASNMISVGMDIPRLGLMVVNAQPKSLSEYIQATSRVGRGDVPGLIVTMYNNMRARDRSHYETFETWHRSFYRDVEATSVTPFASRAQDKAIHAVLVALTRHKIPEMADRPVLDDHRRQKVEQYASLIEQRVARVDPNELQAVGLKLTQLIDEWASRPDLQVYWNDYQEKTSLLMSAEQFAAGSDEDSGLEMDGSRRALWPTPNSMRDVEAGTPFVLRSGLRAGG